jgi:ribulose 1,5-bisphosphate carboxylase large subunit-like protein
MASTQSPRFSASYRIETPLEVERAATAMAGEQSSGTFLKLAGETDALRERHAARVEAVVPLETTKSPSLPGALPGETYQRAEVTLSWPLENIGVSLPNLMATILGNLTELRELSGFRLTDIELPREFLEAMPGPQFSIPGTRRLAGADHMHVNGIRNKFCENDASVIRSAKTCQTPIGSEDDVAMPVFASGQWAGQAPDTYQALGNADLMYLCGGGIMGHPDGPAAGVEHLKQGWEAAMAGIPLEEYAQVHEELRRAIDHYGPAGPGR